mmetsp:Transcript_15162/g.17173  ORF Transcript_15162/g.17173 Transcript_15162/m.17173 type:complete len:91 (+) Transcript_15162:351-623(+)|eukprot:CAMPEP_0184022334 /NCGR_PEP_ID=MMETSP0954-20121128/10541_1 /TAXON_ID=627963 /ORGANISM="Aplanochytrium sp, Strain PBS07" /LENGTH=90 /DNA_ID=CAMNT_0026304683 /DNA_START=279 /DNA_END=551 /DNA_ORIENTATION=-
MEKRFRSESAFELRPFGTFGAGDIDIDVEVITAFEDMYDEERRFASLRSCRPSNPVARLFTEEFEREIPRITSPRVVQQRLQPASSAITA